jgi:hypothetical protein
MTLGGEWMYVHVPVWVSVGMCVYVNHDSLGGLQIIV